MSNVYNIDELSMAAVSGFPAARWTAVIPAAGRGTRLGGASPKILYPLLGKPLVDWAVLRLKPFCRDIIFVLAPGAEAVVRPRLEALIPGRFRIVVQEEPLGMGHAVGLCRPLIKSSHCIIMWVDQVALSERTVLGCLGLADGHPEANLVFPTVLRDHPYIHVVRGPDGRIQRVAQAREENLSEEKGESDCGIFFFKCQALFDALTRAGQALVGPRTGEMNLLPVIPFLDAAPGDVITLRIQDYTESLGLNTEAEARQLEHLLQARESLP